MSEKNSFSKLRYGEDHDLDFQTDTADLLKSMNERGSCRDFTEERVDTKIIRFLCSIALASPTKSDLQQRDIVLIQDQQVHQKLVGLLGTEPWVTGVPNIVVFCGNNRRQRLIHDMREHPFVNDHLDAFFNASVDAGIALSAFVTAAEALGLGCCPISAVRNEPTKVSDLLGLPDFVFPVAGLAFGYPGAAQKPKVSMRLPLSATVHTDRYSEDNIEQAISEYDIRRETQQPYNTQLATEIFGEAERYGWSEDKSRQYAQPERESFGDFVRSKKFNLS